MLFSGLASAGTRFQATTTLAAETGNNTSTADTFIAQTNGNIGASNISKVPTRNMLYAGSTTKIYAHFMPWFGFGDHMSVGYKSNDIAQVQRQVNDIVSRGIDGVTIDWYGRGTFNKNFTFYDQSSQMVMHQAELHPGFQFAIMYDGGALKTCAATVGCDVTQTMIDDLNYVATTYEGSAAYLYFAGRPVIFFFGESTYNLDWTRVRNGVANNPEFIFRNAGGFTHAQSNGGFSWVAPETVSATDPMALLYLDNYDKTSLTDAGMFSTGSGYKGFNDSLAIWGTGRFINQQCGQTWLQSLAEAGKFYSSTNQMLGTQIVTWNDYEEGSEMETGIDNCVTVTATVSGTVLSWSITGQQNTIDHFSIFASQDGQNLMWLADSTASIRNMDIAQFKLNAGNYMMFVKAVGKPSLTNKMSAGIQLTVPNQPPTAALSVTPLTGNAPLTVNASTIGSADVDGSIVSTNIDFGDGSAAASATTASHLYSVAGTYKVLATVTDNLGATSTAAATVIVTSANKAPLAVLNVSPASGIAPATVTASTNGSSDPDGTIASTSIDFGDGSAVVSASSASHVYSTPGTYTVKATVRDNLGATSTASSAVTITANKPPVASLALSASSGYGPLTISASTAGSSDPDGTIASSTINFGDGSASASGPSASHTYSAAGVYTVTATATDNSGASSSTSSTLTVKAPEVIVSSPVAGATGLASPIHVVASGFSGYAVTTIQVYLDGILASSVNAASVDTLVKAAPGAHTISVKSWDTSGRSFIKTVSVTVGNQPPTAVLTASATSILAGGSITASTASSSDPDGSIVASSISFGDGSPAVSATSASHQYTVIGTYKITATVTDNQGASSSANQTITVKPRNIVITSPTNGSTITTSSVQVIATAFSGYTVNATQIYLDGVLKYQTSGVSVNVSLPLSTGTHNIAVKGWDTAGNFMSSVTVTRK
jgi:PKD repeat protein